MAKTKVKRPVVREQVFHMSPSVYEDSVALMEEEDLDNLNDLQFNDAYEIGDVIIIGKAFRITASLKEMGE